MTSVCVRRSDPHHVQINLRDIEINGEPQNLCVEEPSGFCTAVVDSGTSFLTAPSEVSTLLLPQLLAERSCSNVANLPNITYVLDSERYELTPEGATDLWSLHGMLHV